MISVVLGQTLASVLTPQLSQLALAVNTCDSFAATYVPMIAFLEATAVHFVTRVS